MWVYTPAWLVYSEERLAYEKEDLLLMVATFATINIISGGGEPAGGSSEQLSSMRALTKTDIFDINMWILIARID